MAPFDINLAHLPEVAANIAVPAVELVAGITLEVALITVNAAVVTNSRILPELELAAGRVTVQVAAPVNTNTASLAPTV